MKKKKRPFLLAYKAEETLPGLHERGNQKARDQIADQD